MTPEAATDPLDRLDATLKARTGLRLRVACPSQEFSAEEMSFGPGRWLSSSRGLWESLRVASHANSALVMLQAPPVGRAVEDYLLGVVPPDVTSEADRRARHALVEIDDDGERHLSEKVLADTRLVERLRCTVELAGRAGHSVDGLACFASSRRMADLADALGLKLLEADPQLLGWGDKSGSRQLFRAAGVRHLPGSYVADHDVPSLAARLAALVRDHGPGHWIVKLDRGFGSGHGNAFVDIRTDSATGIERELLTSLCPASTAVDRPQFLQWLHRVGAIVERRVRCAPGTTLGAPSALGHLSVASAAGARTELLGIHDQLVGAAGDYLGCRYPARSEYRAEAAQEADKAFSALAARGVVGHVGVDFIAVPPADGSDGSALYATEINLRQTGSTHPNRTVRAVLPLARNAAGELIARDGHDVYFRATDSVLTPSCRGLPAAHLISALRRSARLSLDPDAGRGVVPHLWPALARFGKIGVTAIGRSAAECDQLMAEFTELLVRLGESGPRSRTAFI
ncbi:ATP-grasp domain-containing protein [Streptomyces sp. NPDC051098]|uniref:ATP-grasp domain-containing protein n=1 Tax=Streptomyces sp. NPDC051098 TaxID=3155411 RepID=UPI00341B9C7D